MNVRLCAPLLAALSLSPLALADTPAQRCQDLLESGMRMAGWEQHCQFRAANKTPWRCCVTLSYYLYCLRSHA